MASADWGVVCRALLGPTDGQLLLVAPRASSELDVIFAGRRASANEVAAGAVVVWLGEPAAPDQRTALLASLAARLGAGAPLIIVDHNQPRSRRARIANAIRLLLQGLPSARARYPVAREAAQAGFTVEQLRLTDAERIQVLRAVRTG